MAVSLKLGLSPCPNDTFIFHALLHGLVRPEFSAEIAVEPVFADVEQLNQAALRGRLPVTKVSAGVLPHILDKYRILSAGAALGWGCGPLIVCADPEASPANGRVAIPGRNTTACLLLALHGGWQGERIELRFDEIMPALARGEADFGVIIHEGRFTWQDAGLHKCLDLGQWWEERFRMPLPLGAIVARRDLDLDLARSLEKAIAASVAFAWQNPDESQAFIRRHAQELDPEVIGAHVKTFVTDFSADLGQTGREAVLHLVSRKQRGASARAIQDIFLSN